MRNRRHLFPLILMFLIFFLTSCSTQTYGCDMINSCNLFSSGLLAIQNNDGWGYINNRGQEVIPFSFDEAGAFYKDIAIVAIDNQYQLINQSGQLLLSSGKDFIYRDLFSNLLIYKDGERYGLMSEKGTILTNPLFDSIGTFSEGLAPILVDSLWGFIDTKGQIQIEPQYEEARSFSNQRALVQTNRHYGFINRNNEMVIPATLTHGHSFGIDGMAIIEDENRDYLINNQGKEVLSGDRIEGGPYYYSAVEESSDPFKIYRFNGAKVSDTPYSNVTYRYLSKSFSVATVSTFPDQDLLTIILDNKGSIIRTVAKENIAYFIDQSTHQFYYAETVDNTTTLYQPNGNSISYQGVIVQINHSLVSVSNNDRTGVYDLRGKTVISPLYDIILQFDDSFYWVLVNYEWGVLDSKGNILVNFKYKNFNPLYNFRL